MRDPQNRQILSVSELNDISRRLLEGALTDIWVEGEISNFASPTSGHWYFTLKDRNAQLRCAMFRNRNLRVGQRPKNGDQMLVRGSASIYGARGDYQLIAEHMEPAGLGALQRALDALKKTLAAEGLFAEEHKRALPALPRHLGIITSATGAALRDILTVLRRRHPGLLVTLFPVVVQGDDAAAQLSAAVKRANAVASRLTPVLDVLIIGRGGGSLEDLFAFNDETLARAIFASELPIISAVGHETDFSISDLVADVRAPTPSAAAEILSPDRAQLLTDVARLERRLVQQMQRRITVDRQQVAGVAKRLRHPGSRLRDQVQRLDELESRLRTAIRQQLRYERQRLARAMSVILGANPQRSVTQHQHQLQVLKRRMDRAMRLHLSRRRERLQASSQLLDSVSPLATLSRGYAIVRDPAGQVLRSSQQVRVGDQIKTTLHEGELDCTVTTVYSSNQ